MCLCARIDAFYTNLARRAGKCDQFVCAYSRIVSVQHCVCVGVWVCIMNTKSTSTAASRVCKRFTGISCRGLKHITCNLEVISFKLYIVSYCCCYFILNSGFFMVYNINKRTKTNWITLIFLYCSDLQSNLFLDSIHYDCIVYKQL